MIRDIIDDVTIANKALIKVAESPIDNLEDATNTAARILNAIMAQAKRYVFKIYPWNCLRERTVIVKSADTPAFGFNYKYSLPADHLRAIAIQDDSGTFIPFYEATYGGSISQNKQFVIEGNYLLTDTMPQINTVNNQTGLNFVYTKYPSNLMVLDPNLVELLAYYLAIEICYTLTGSAGLKTQLINEYTQCLKVARAANAQEIAPGIPIGPVIGAHW